MSKSRLPSLGDLVADDALRVHQLCTGFEAAWQNCVGGGKRPVLEEWLVEVPLPVRKVLLDELLRLELEYRRKAGERPVLAEYLTQFSTDEVLLRRLLSETGPVGDELNKSTDPSQAQLKATPLIARADKPTPVLDQGYRTTTPEAQSTGGEGGTNAELRLPGYEILGQLGVGGMGIVYKARQIRADRVVALKVIKAGIEAGATELAYFKTEAEAIARVQHANIVQVFEVGEHAGRPFFSLEFCSGGSLDKRLNGAPLPPRDAARLVESLARGIQAAHVRQILHRDLKPANILLAEDGTPKITDFGLARKLDDMGLGETGFIVGTPSYMAPEQAAGAGKKAIKETADVYALGAILYECLTGRPPFKGPSMLDTLLMVRQDEPVPPSQLQRGVSRDLETIALKCLRKESDRRYGSAGELAEELRRFQAGEPILARPVGGLERGVKWVRRNPAVAGLLGLVMLTLLAGVVVSSYFGINATIRANEADAARKDAEKQQKNAEKQKDIAEAKEKKAQKAREFLASIFELSDRSGPRGTMTARQILDGAERTIPQTFQDQPELQRELQADVDGIIARITADAPLAMILVSTGPVKFQPSQKSERKPVRSTLLYAGDRLTLGIDARVDVVMLGDMHQERLGPGATFTVQRKGCEPSASVKRSNDLMFPFVHLPKSSFYMGGGGSKAGKKIEIEEDFEICLFDVTQGQWEAVMGNNPSHFSRFGAGRTEVAPFSDEELKLFPVDTVSWEDVHEFIKELNVLESKRGGKWHYRLLKEAEWEYACRSGATTEEECSYRFYFDKPTNELSSEQANFNGNIAYGNAPKGKYLQRSSRVGEYPANKLGLCDMHGNVWQWCEDSYDPEGSGRVVRGGSWLGSYDDCQAANRDGIAPKDRYFTIGFRLARVLR